MKKNVLVGMIAAALGCAPEMPNNVPVNKPSVVLNAPERNAFVGPMYEPPKPSELSPEEQLAQKTLSADIARYLMKHHVDAKKWVDFSDEMKENYRGPVSDVFAQGGVVYSGVVFEQALPSAAINSHDMKPMLLKIDGKYALMFESTKMVSDGEVITRSLLVDKHLDGVVDVNYGTAHMADEKRTPFILGSEVDVMSELSFKLLSTIYQREVIDKEQH